MGPGDVRLRAATPRDLPWLERLVASPDVAPYLSTDAAPGLTSAVEAGEVLTIETDGAPAGAVTVAIVNRRSRIGAVRGLMVEPDLRGRGLATAVLRALADRFLASGRLHRLEAEVYGFNVAAQRAFEAAGFRREGVRRRAYERAGGWQDGISFGLVAEDLD